MCVCLQPTPLQITILTGFIYTFGVLETNGGEFGWETESWFWSPEYAKRRTEG